MASELTNKLWRPFLSLSLSPSLSSACSFISAFRNTDRQDVIWEAPHVPRVNVNCGLLASSVPTANYAPHYRLRDGGKNLHRCHRPRSHHHRPRPANPFSQGFDGMGMDGQLLIAPSLLPSSLPRRNFPVRDSHLAVVNGSPA